MFTWYLIGAGITMVTFAIDGAIDGLLSLFGLPVSWLFVVYFGLSVYQHSFCPN